jgi:hypothetical protein
MANLSGVKIRGTNNYKGLMTIGETITEGLTTTLKVVGDGMGGYSPLQLSTKEIGANKTVALSAGATNEQLFNLSYTINNSGAQTGTFTGILMNATETALNGMAHNLMDLRIGGVSRFLITTSGGIVATQGYHYGLGFIVQGSQGLIKLEHPVSGAVRIRTSGEGKLLLSGDVSTMFDLLQFGGTSNAYPALKRNGATLEVVTADGLGTAAIVAQTFSTGLGAIVGSNYFSVSDAGWYRPAANQFAISLNGLSNAHFTFGKVDDTTTVNIIKGSSDPEGAVTATQGSVYMRTGGGAGSSFYVKESGSGNTGWVGK